MTEYEAADLAASYFSVGIAMVGLYATSTSGYLIAAYNVGSKLSKSQILVISGLFLFLALLAVWGSYSNMRWAALLVESVPEVLPRRVPGGIRPFHFGAIIQLVGIFACFKFMWDVRHLCMAILWEWFITLVPCGAITGIFVNVSRYLRLHIWLKLILD